jgi:assimilatory nitrate reductase catalytic subunit
MGVSEKALRAAIFAGATSVAELKAQLKAGTGCGACVPELEGLLRRALNLS